MAQSYVSGQIIKVVYNNLFRNFYLHECLNADKATKYKPFVISADNNDTIKVLLLRTLTPEDILKRPPSLILLNSLALPS
jgi:hypothetical protein